ncbi:tyrosine-type recombinase/integrase [Nocardioides sp. W3-2-3]|uniref:tyrosine-type recombinase/integrase n=1 Tax=Nocardioides convexus TaxID=2712224 RepID=UPI0024181499|nr:tyrosine-type recombinase/integrase [Nocardioides convexus]NGZ99677.1 tyrosine-type recombinase/integrase [Nocardioides convexus]
MSLFGLLIDYVDLNIWQINVHGVATRNGWRPYAKSQKSHRAAPIPRRLRERFAEHCAGLAPGDLVFPAPGGGVWNDRNFATRVFTPALERAAVRPGTPYDMRHTAASRLVQRGVDLKRVQEPAGAREVLHDAALRPPPAGRVRRDPERVGRVALGAPSSPRPHGHFGSLTTKKPPICVSAGQGLFSCWWAILGLNQ